MKKNSKCVVKTFPFFFLYSAILSLSSPVVIRTSLSKQSYSQQFNSKIYYIFRDESSLISLFVIVDFFIVHSCLRFDGLSVHRLVEGEKCFQALLDQRLPDEGHRQNNNVTDVVEFSVDRPPLIEAKVSERYQAVAGDDEAVQFADRKNSNTHRDGLSSLLKLWVVLEHRLNLWNGK